MARDVSKRLPKSRTKGGRSAAGKAAGKRHKERVDAAQSFPFMNRGGARKGAGRKAAFRGDGKRLHHSHAARKRVTRHRPVHVTLNLVAGLPSLRGALLAVHVLAAIAGGNQREDFRVVHFSVQSNHIHLIGEAHGNEALARGMRGIGGRIAKKVNGVLGRKGRVIADRYHAHVLNTRAEVRNAVRYVLRNAERHDVLRGMTESAEANARDTEYARDTESARDTEYAEGGENERGPGRAWWSGLDPLSSAVVFPYWLEAEGAAAGGAPEALVEGLGAIVRSAQCALFRIAFVGAPLSLQEVLPEQRRRGAGRGAGAASRARPCGGLEA